MKIFALYSKPGRSTWNGWWVTLMQEAAVPTMKGLSFGQLEDHFL
jgi:hypothetical protein